MRDKMDWREILKQMLEKAEKGIYDDLDESEPEVIVIPKGEEDSVFKFLTDLGFDMPEMDAIDLEIEKLIDAGKFVVFEKVECIH